MLEDSHGRRYGMKWKRQKNDKNQLIVSNWFCFLIGCIRLAADE